MFPISISSCIILQCFLVLSKILPDIIKFEKYKRERIRRKEGRMTEGREEGREEGRKSGRKKRGYVFAT